MMDMPVVPAHATRNQRLALLAAVLAVLWLALSLFSSILLPFVAAAVIAYIADPACQKLTHLGIGRGAASALIVVGMVLGVLTCILLLYPLLMSQIGLMLSRAPDYAAELAAFAKRVLTHAQAQMGPGMINDKISELVSSQAGSVLSVGSQAVARVVSSGFAIFNVVTLLLVTPIVAFYLLRDWPAIVGTVDDWVPLRYRAVVRAQAREVDRILSAWVRGQAMCCVLLALFYAVALSLVGLDLALVIGLTAGLLSFIPYVGTITGGLAAFGLACSQFPTWDGVWHVGIVFAIGQVLEGYVIYPRFLGDRVELPDIWVIFALFAGGAAFGFLGVMLAVPVAATIGVLARFWLRRYRDSALYLDQPS
jgi:predicted PurR-regulated permease PerM